MSTTNNNRSRRPIDDGSTDPVQYDNGFTKQDLTRKRRLGRHCGARRGIAGCATSLGQNPRGPAALHATIPNLQDMAPPAEMAESSPPNNLRHTSPQWRQICPHSDLVGAVTARFSHRPMAPATRISSRTRGRPSCPTRPDPFTALDRSRLAPSAIRVGSRLLEKFYGAPAPPPDSEVAPVPGLLLPYSLVMARVKNPRLPTRG